MSPEDREWVTVVHSMAKANSLAIEQMQSVIKDAVVRSRLSIVVAATLFAELAQRTGTGRETLDEMLAGLEGGLTQTFDHGAYGSELKSLVTTVLNEIVERAHVHLRK